LIPLYRATIFFSLNGLSSLWPSRTKNPDRGTVHQRF